MHPTEGVILIDGMDTSHYDQIWEIRKTAGMVFQNPDNQFVGATVEDDVAFGLENLGIETDKMHKIVNNVLKKVRMEDFKERQPDQLSGGQKQRVAITGVLASKPEIIILDEATSSLDTKSEFNIQESIKVLSEDTTMIIIAHRLSTIEQADRIIVFDAGAIVEMGTHQELLEKNNIYASLYRLGEENP